MIIERILQIFFDLINWIFSLIPSLSLPSGMLSSFSNIYGYIISVNYFLPLTTLGICIAFMLAVKNMTLIWHMLQWVIRKIPGVS